MMSQISAFLAHETPFQLAALAAAALIWAGGAVAMWKARSWSRRLAYIAGGLVLGYYEIHMTWLWLGLGLALIFGPRLLDRGVARSRSSSG